MSLNTNNNNKHVDNSSSFNIVYFLLFLVLVLILVLIDQIIKLEFCSLNYIFSNCILNTGSAYGLFSNMKYYTSIIAIFGVLISTILIVFYSYFIREFGLVITSLFTAGIISNTIDRIFFGAVRDMFIIPYFPIFGIFNVADVYLFISALYILYKLIILK